MYISMCIKEVAGFKPGAFYETYTESGFPYYYVRPEMTEKTYEKLAEQDYNSSFVLARNSFSLEMPGLFPYKKWNWSKFKLETQHRELLQFGYYEFRDLNREQLRLVQREILLPVKLMKKYTFDERDFQKADHELNHLSVIAQMDLSDEELKTEIKVTKAMIEYLLTLAKKEKRYAKGRY